MSTQDLIASLQRKKTRLGTMASPSMLAKVSEFVPTGCLPLDIIMGGGVPVGRLTEIYGDTSTGKSLLAAHILAETQQAGGVGVLLDSETATSVEVMEAVGVNPAECIYSVPSTDEEVYADITEAIEARNSVAPGTLMTIVWDSVAATSSDAEVEKVKKEGLGGASIATHARLISLMCRVIPRTVARERIALVFINQTRENIGVMFGDKMTTFGGRGIAYYSSVRLEMAKAKTLTDADDNPVGIDVRCWVAKSKVSVPFGKCRFPILFGVGIDKPGAIFNWIKDKHLAEVKGSWYVIDALGLKFQSAGWDAIYTKHHKAIECWLWEQAGYSEE